MLLQLGWLCSFFSLFCQKQLTENFRMSAISGRKKKAEAILRIYNLLIFMTLEEKECKRTNSLPNKLPVLVSRANFRCISPTKYITDLKPKHLGIN